MHNNLNTLEMKQVLELQPFIPNANHLNIWQLNNLSHRLKGNLSKYKPFSPTNTQLWVKLWESAHMWTLPVFQGGSLKWTLKFLLKHTTFYQNFEISLISTKTLPTVQVKKNPHFLFFSMINCLFFWEKLGEIVENFSRFLQEIQYFLQEIPVFLPEIVGFYL